ncbi:phosphoglycerate dehydrogenase [Pseudobdellovibrio exovorus]|uniref:D-3-phosphoglycerate dehydrogenase n=1 Tax=Pseudobdellovibrio exovorus JSS TaxID=1184267 RepID=M4VS92_9BACT|nr:phosphoglycerate dehydrogenase [Pseudobdellovibrio exovorus]AGH96059.1 D-3-phosphoglycerate dehydrogenase [Pseudobdellovibrio exovorus JSS]
MRILLAENIHSVAKEKLIEEGFKVDLLTHAPSEDEYNQILQNYDVLGIRSKSDINERILQNNQHLLAIGAFCIGTNQIDLTCANNFGIPVFNAPHSNTRSVAELVMAEMIALSRQLGDRNTLAHQGEWVKSAEGSREVRGKTLGIVGYGHIGSQVSILAEAFGMKVIFYDIVKKLPLGNARATTHLHELLKEADFISLHVPETPETMNMISSAELTTMKKGSYVINASRGTVIVIEDLVNALKSNHIAGCALDVFPQEPASNKEKFKSPLQGLKNVILTPHIGGSTEEAQYAIGLEVAESFRKFIRYGTTAGAVNFPNVDLGAKDKVTRIMNVHRNEPGVLGELNGFISEAKANIQGQYLSTDQKIGYLVTDLELDWATTTAEQLAAKFESSKRNIKTRIVF